MARRCCRAVELPGAPGVPPLPGVALPSAGLCRSRANGTAEGQPVPKDTLTESAMKRPSGAGRRQGEGRLQRTKKGIMGRKANEAV
jgi:hypothetical protein